MHITHIFTYRFHFVCRRRNLISNFIQRTSSLSSLFLITLNTLSFSAQLWIKNNIYFLLKSIKCNSKRNDQVNRLDLALRRCKIKMEIMIYQMTFVFNDNIYLIGPESSLSSIFFSVFFSPFFIPLTRTRLNHCMYRISLKYRLFQRFSFIFIFLAAKNRCVSWVHSKTEDQLFF